MSNKLSNKVLHGFIAWRPQPYDLARRIIDGNNPAKFGAKKHSLREVVLFITRLSLRPVIFASMKHWYRKTTLQPIRFGYFTTVFRLNNDVIKIYDFTTKLDDKTLNNTYKVVKQSYDIAHKYLGSFVNPTEIYIDLHPLTNDKCIMMKQSYVEGKPLRGSSYSTQMNTLQKESFIKFLRINEEMRNNTGYTADINANNLFLVDNSIILVDTIPSGQVVAKNRRSTINILKRELYYLDKLTLEH